MKEWGIKRIVIRRPAEGSPKRREVGKMKVGKTKGIPSFVIRQPAEEASEDPQSERMVSDEGIPSFTNRLTYLGQYKMEYIWNMNLMTLIQERYTDFVDLCRSHKVNKIFGFGSSITDHFDPQSSDIDLVVRIDIDDPADRGEALLSLWDKLEALFQRKVDLLTEDSIRNPYLKSNINRTKKLIYDGEGEKVFV